MLTRVISGGQTGADIAGVQSAYIFGIETGGWMPPNFLTEIGPRPDLSDKYGFVEIEANTTNPKYGYVVRTKANARDSDGTIRFARNFQSAGEICTLRAIQQFKKPYIDVNIDEPISVDEVVVWINDNNIEVLNVAGNRESTCRGVGRFTFEFMSEVYEALHGSCKENDGERPSD